jgi:hypothetical protein
MTTPSVIAGECCMIDGCQPQKDPVAHGFVGVANVTSGDEDALVSAGSPSTKL